MKKKLVTLKEALPAMVRVFCRRAKGDDTVRNYAIKNDRCINHYIYFVTKYYFDYKYHRYENDAFYTKLLEDIYSILEKFLTEYIPMNVYQDCLDIAGEVFRSDFFGYTKPNSEREMIIMGIVHYVLETSDIRKDQPFYMDIKKKLHSDYGSGSEKGDFYELFSDRLSTIKDEPRWCADEKELSSKTEYEIKHEAWVDEFFGVNGSVSENSSENVLTETEQTSLQLPLPPFKKSNVALIWKERLMEFFGENVHIPLNSSKYNPILRYLVWFMEEWDKQGLLIKQPNRAAIQFLVETCGFKCDGVSVKRIAGVLGNLRKMTDELCEEKELVRKYIENT